MSPTVATDARSSEDPRCDARARTAYHEAGHAVVGWHLKHIVHSVSIIPDHDSAGRANVAQYVRFRPTAELTVLFGGLAAEHVFCGTPYESHAVLATYAGPFEHDAQRIHELTAGACPTVYAALRRHDFAQARALRLVRRYRLHVERVAGALLARDTLTMQEFHMLVNTVKGGA